MQVLMCPPRFFGIEYEINPWMNRRRQSDARLAQEQWQSLYRLLQERLRVDVLLIDPEPGLPDMVFTANAGLVWDHHFIASNFRYEVRRGEARHFERWFASRNYQVSCLSEKNYFEGEGDLLKCGSLLFAGYPKRSTLTAHRRAGEIMGRKVLSLKLTSEWFYHLDTCFCPLSTDAALYYPGAFDAESCQLLEDHIDTLIAVEEEEARRFVCNAVVIDNNVIVNQGCAKTRRRLEAMGFAVFEISFSEFIKSGGSAKCLLLKMPHSHN